MNKVFDQRQHYVPEGYLKGFTKNGDGFLHELKKSDFQIKRRHINNVCYRTNFYDISDEPLLQRFSIKPRYLEYSFNYENTLPPLLKDISNHVPYISRKEFEIIVEAYVSIKHRTPFFRKKVDELQREGDGKLFDDTAAKLKEDVQWILDLHPDFNYDDYVADFKSNMLNDKDLATKSHHRSLVEFSRNINEAVRDAILKILSMNISIIEAYDLDDCFIVSDNPGYSIQKNNRIFNTNYGNFDMIHFPINSKQLVVLSDFDPLNHIRPLIRLNYVKVKPIMVQEINLKLFEMADEKVFCENRTFLERFRSTLKNQRLY